jgi:3-hydroxybutyryl-CoA dehydrogenase
VEEGIEGLRNSKKRMAKSEKQISSDIKVVGIIGEGKMGTNLFYYLLDFGFSLVWICSKDANIDKIIKSFSKKIKRSLDAGIIDEITYSDLQIKTIISSDLQHLKDCDLIIEAIPEDIGLKQQLFMKLEQLTSGDCIFASNSSSFNPSELSISLSGKNRFTGLHFFYPVSLKNMVEFIVSDNTSMVVIEKVKQFLSVIKRDHLYLKEKDSFILNKIYLDFQNEAFLIVLEENLSISQMDALIKTFLFPIGVFDFCDSVGNDIMLEAVRNYTREYTDKAHFLKFTHELERLVNENRFGIKNGAGFYTYPFEATDDGFSLNDLRQDVVQRTIDRLQITMTDSIKKFSSRSGISSYILNNAMKEYLGSGKDLISIQV